MHLHLDFVLFEKHKKKRTERKNIIIMMIVNASISSITNVTTNVQKVLKKN